MDGELGSGLRRFWRFSRPQIAVEALGDVSGPFLVDIPHNGHNKVLGRQYAVIPVHTVGPGEPFDLGRITDKRV